MLLATVLVLFGIGTITGKAFDISRSDNVALYWGQNSYGATHSDTANWQQHLGYYCGDSNSDVILISFLHVFFSTGGLPSIDLANTCNVNDNAVFPGTNLPNCQFLASDIQTCQAKGKAVLLSLGGATGAASFTSDAQAQTFADTVWNLFLGGSSSTRPFGAAVLDGIDLDIEGGGSTGYAAFVNRLRSHYNGASKKYYVTAAPQCPYPDAYLSPILNAVGVDAVFVQFYNNYCSLPNYGTSNFNFADWDNWAKTVAPNKNVKIYVGAPASSTAAGSGYVSGAQLATIAKGLKATYSTFGGVMFWDASQAYANGRIDATAKNALLGGASAPTTTTKATTTTKSVTTTTKITTTTTKTTTTTTKTPTPTGGSCSGVSPWSATTTYVGGDKATFKSHLWIAKWWSYGDTPGGSADVWADNGACTTKRATRSEAEFHALLNAAKRVAHGAENIAEAKPVRTVAAEISIQTARSEGGHPREESRHRFRREAS